MNLSWEQEEVVNSNANKIVVVAGAGSGKAQPNDTIIPTPNGPVKLGDIKVGDFVFDRFGNPTKVLDVYPQGLKDNYKVTLSDGRFTYCNDQHLWSYYPNKGQGKTLRTATLRELIDKGISGIDARGHNYNNFSIPNAEPVKYNEKILPVDPYVVGVFLGDGCCKEDRLTLSSNDEYIVKEINTLIHGLKYKKNSEKNYSWHFIKEENEYRDIPFKTKEIFNGIEEYICQKASDKSIPPIYKYSNIEQRLSLIQGLMDTDGSIANSGNRFNINFTNTSKKLIDDIVEVLGSLGYQTSIRIDKREDKYTNNCCYELHINLPNTEKFKLFRLPRKKNIALESINYPKRRHYDRVYISKVEKMPEQVEMTCIYVDNPEHLYLTNDFIVTHNTRVLVARLERLIDEGVDPSTIFAITYTNNAAQEIQERIGRDDVFIGTIHSLACKILRKNGIPVQDAIDNEDFDRFFSLIKKHHPVIPPVEYLLVDEFQDVSLNEYRFMIEDLKPTNLFVVGDSRQNIYEFKGSSFEFFENLIEDPTSTVYELTEDYRNPKEIIKFANKFIAGMTDIYITEVECMNEEKGFVEKLDYSGNALLTRIQEAGAPFNSWFILCRTNREVGSIIDLLKDNDIPCETFKKSEKTFQEMQATIRANTVKVLTIHSAKGLEADNVAVIGARNFNKSEKRLNYVAATRAKKRLYWFKSERERRHPTEHMVSFKTLGGPRSQVNVARRDMATTWSDTRWDAYLRDGESEEDSYYSRMPDWPDF